MTPAAAAQDAPMLSDARVRDTLRTLLHRTIHVERLLSRTEIAEQSGVNVHTIDALLSRDPAKHRTIGAAVCLSIAVVLGCRAVNSVLALVGYGGAEPLDETSALKPGEVVAKCAEEFAVIAGAAASGRFDHTTQPAVQAAADMLIATVLPLSSAGEAA